MPVKIPTSEEFSADQQVEDRFFYWRLCDELTVVQATLLLLGIRPDSNGISNYVMGWSAEKRPENFDAALMVISSALKMGKVVGKIEPYTETVNGGSFQFEERPIEGTVNPDISTVDVLSLKNYLINEKGITHGFFGPTLYEKYSTPAYLDPSNKHYASKLSAAVEAWLAVTEAKDFENGGTPKQAIEKWLRVNSGRLGLILDNGNPNNQGIGEIAKIVNWQPTGGASKTPAKARTADNKTNPPTPLKSVK